MRIACYCRVSTSKREQLDSLHNQIKFFETLAKNKGYELYKIYADEGVSAAKKLEKKHRKQFLEMMKDARLRKFDTILVKDITRFSRNVIDFLNCIEELRDLGINLLFTSYDMDIKEADQTYLTMMAVFAEDESRRLSIKTKFGKNITAQKGRVPNFVFGYDKVDNYTLAINPEESSIVKTMFELYADQKWGTTKIAEWLTKEKIKTKKNNQTGWSQKTVIDILRNQLYIGKVINKKSEVTDFKTGKRKQLERQPEFIVERPEFQIIEDDLFFRVQEILQERQETFSLFKKRESYKYSFSNLIKCSECGYSFRRCQRQYTNSGNLYTWWVCSYRNAHGADSCINQIRVDEKELTDALVLFLKQILKDKKNVVKQITNQIKHLIDVNRNLDENSPEELEKRLIKLTSEKSKYMDMYKNDIINMDELKGYTTSLNQEIDVLKTQLSKVNKPVVISNQDIEKYVHAYLEKIDMILKQDILDNKLLKEIIEQIQVKPDGTINIVFKIDSQGNLTANLPLQVVEVNLSDLPTHLDTSLHKDVTKWSDVSLRVS